MKKKFAKSVGLVCLFTVLVAVIAMGTLQYAAAHTNNKNFTQGKLNTIIEIINGKKNQIELWEKIVTATGTPSEELEALLASMETLDILQKVEVGDNGFAYAIDKNTGLVKYHSNKNVIGQKASEWGIELSTSEGVIRTEDFYGFYDQREYQDMIYGVFIPTYEYFSGTLWDTLIVFFNIILQMSICAFLINLAINKQVIRPLNHVISAVKKVAEGDLNTRISENSNAEFTTLSKNINIMVENMQTIIETNDELLEKQNKVIQKEEVQLQNIREICDVLDMASHETMENAYKIHKGTESQEEAIFYLKKVMDDLVSQLNTSADASSEVYALTENTALRMVQNRRQMKELESAMFEISEMAGKIEKIIGDINAIAQQTNMLSLNASIEAARAGEMGRGFSVVAEQVGELAAKSSEAAKETKELITGSVEAVEKGKSISFKTMENFDGMAKEVESANNHVKGMVSMVRDNAEEIVRAMDGLKKIEQVVESNVTISENSKQVSESMAKETEKLKELMA